MSDASASVSADTTPQSEDDAAARPPPAKRARAEDRGPALVKLILELQKKVYNGKIVPLRILGAGHKPDVIKRQFERITHDPSKSTAPCLYIMVYFKEPVDFEKLQSDIEKSIAHPMLPIYIGQTSNFYDRFRKFRNGKFKHPVPERHETDEDLQEMLFSTVCG